jgi:saccharopine dehydrogenase-like NADP-dependent oxidoreductase
MKILVLGGGAQGRVIARDLARSLRDAQVTVADLTQATLPVLPNLSWIEADLADPATIARLLRDYDLGVGALPARLGYGAMQAAVEAKRNLVDVSFAAEDALTLDASARAAGITIAPDCGLAPGLSHLLVGHLAARDGTPDEVMIMVGGVAEDATRPYGYVVTWSLDDLLEEYVRSARIIRDGRLAEVPAFSALERVHIDGVGEMEAFYSDGLRTLLETLPGVREMGEKTLRWPGHAEAVMQLVKSGDLLEELRRRCVANPPRDLVVLSVQTRRGEARHEVTMVDRYDPKSGLTAMSRTTAYTTSVVTQLAARGGLKEKGVQPLERIGRDERAYSFIVAEMESRGVRFKGV